MKIKKLSNAVQAPALLGFKTSLISIWAIFSIAIAALALPSAAMAMGTFLKDVVTPYGNSSVYNLCANCHQDWDGRDSRDNLGVSYYLYDNKTNDSGPTAGFLGLDPDGDGFTTGVELTNSNTQTKPASSTRWMPGSADKDGDGYISIYHRGDESGMPAQRKGIVEFGYVAPPGTAAPGDNNFTGFLYYGPNGWDIDDNDPTQGNSAGAWPTAAGVVLAPGTTSDSAPPAAINNLRASALTSLNLPLTWTAVGDDGNVGTAYAYDLRYTTETLANAKSYNPRLPQHWSTMWDIPDCDVDESTGWYLAKAGTPVGGFPTSACAGSWNAGGGDTPLMRALYETSPLISGSPQTYSITQKSTATISSNVRPNTIVDGSTYWLAIRTSDGVMIPTGGVPIETPTGFTENLSGLSNIVAITAGASGVAIQTGAVGAAAQQNFPITNPNTSDTIINIVGLGLGSATTVNAARLYDAEKPAASNTITCTISARTATTMSLSCPTLGKQGGLYDLDLLLGSTLKASWVDAFNLDSSGEFSLSASSYSVNENGVSASVTVNRQYGSIGAVTVSYATSNGTATAGSDYTAASGILSWANGDSSSRTVTVPILDDLVYEGNETLSFNLSSPTGGAVLSATNPIAATLSIVDDETPPTLQFSQTNYSGDESVTPGNLTVILSNAAGQPVMVNYTVSGTAQGGGVDYTLANGVLTFNAGETSKDISAIIVDDVLNEVSEDINVTLSAPVNAVLGTNTLGTYTITDNDPLPSVAFAAASSSGLESLTPANMAVSLSAPSGKTVQVTYTVAGTATGGGVDYTLANGTVTFDPGMTSQTISAVIVNDLLPESSETIVVTLGIPTNALQGAITTHTYTILDDETPVTTTTTTSTTTSSSTTSSSTTSTTTSSTTTSSTTTSTTTSSTTTSSTTTSTTTTSSTTTSSTTTSTTTSSTTTSSTASTTTTLPGTVNLKMTLLSAPTTPLPSGASLTIHHTVANLGNAPATAFSIGFELVPSNPLVLPIVLPSQSLSGLSALTQLTMDTIVVLPATLADGSYTLRATADSTGVVTESEEGDNILLGSVITVQNNRDLVLSSVALASGTPGSMAIGSSFNVNNAVQNQGTLSTLASNVKFYLSLDGLYGTGDVLVGTRTLSAMPGSSTSSLLATALKIPLTLAMLPTTATSTPYYLIAIVDQSNTVKLESNSLGTGETNNTVVLSPPINVLRDQNVQVSALSTVRTQAIGSSFSVNNTVQNVGTTPVSGSATIRFYLSKDRAFNTTGTTTNPADVLLGTRTVTAATLATTTPTTADTTVKVPLTTTPGDWYLLAVADPTNTLKETPLPGAEGDNVWASLSPDISVWRDQDAIIDSASTTTTAIGKGTTLGVFYVNNVVKNQGQTSTSAGVNARIYLSPVAGGALIQIGTRTTTALATGASSSSPLGGTKVTVPAGALSGQYHLVVVADPTNTLLETNPLGTAESNNSYTVPGISGPWVINVQ